MRVEFNDFYGQHVEIHNETSSGNVRMRVCTTKSLNDLPSKTKADCEIETDISLDEGQIMMLFGALKTMMERF